MTAAPNIGTSKSVSVLKEFKTANDFYIPKYNKQREDFPIIPKAVVKKLFVRMDYDMNGFISLEELQTFCANSHLALLTPEIVREMFYEITKKRGIVHKEQLDSPLTLDEIYLCCNFLLSYRSQRKVLYGSKDKDMVSEV